MMNHKLALVCSLLFIVITSGEEYQWCMVQSSDVTSKQEKGVHSSFSSDGNLVIDATILNRGCGGTDSHIFAFISDDIDENEFTKWSRIKYTMQFWGSSSCWSILGDTVYGFEIPFDGTFNSGLHIFDPTQNDSIISNDLLYGNYSGQNRTCNNEPSNFWHSLHEHTGYKGSITVEQRRDMNATTAAIGSGHSCSIPSITKIRYSDIQVAFQTDVALQCVKPNKNNNNDSFAVETVIYVVVGIIVGISICVCFVYKYRSKFHDTGNNNEIDSSQRNEPTQKHVETEIMTVGADKYVQPSAPIDNGGGFDKKGNGDNLCIFCCTNDANMCANPCGHVFVCNECYDIKMDQLKQCPQCRKDIINCIRLFKAGFQN
eukprot:315973_1